MVTRTDNTRINKVKLKEIFSKTCTKSTVGIELTLHQLSPYIGKIKSSIAGFLIEHFTKKGDLICDPFCGAGTIPLEGWHLGRNVFANDLNEYAHVLTKAKLYPPDSLEDVLREIEKIDALVQNNKSKVDLRKAPLWVRNFFHKETLREIILWVEILKTRKANFLLSCILGILHHQRPGFLSFPSSHTVPYLRKKKFPPNIYPHLYEYRSVKDRLIKKVHRAFKRLPALDNSLNRKCSNLDASSINYDKGSINAIISSPPYMRKLDYGRDNRLRLWFLGVQDTKKLDTGISPKETDFLTMMKKCLVKWNLALVNNGRCILFLGDNFSSKYRMKLPELIENIAANEVGGYKLIFKHVSIIPDNRRVRRNYFGNKTETILVFQKIN